MRPLVVLILMLSGAVLTAAGQPAAGPQLSCGTSSTLAKLTDDIGGRYLTASGTLRVLIVFASFPDDSTPHPFWPAHQPPSGMHDFIDPDTSSRSASPANLTNYFNQMSLGKLRLIGDAVFVETSHASTEYANGSFRRANIAVLQEKVDPLVDFSQYDHWSNPGQYSQSNTPDGRVDMIVMVWRTTIFENIGNASLGGALPDTAGIILDGTRIDIGFPENYQKAQGSGVTCECPPTDTPVKLRRTIAHEIGHWLLGGAHPYDPDPLLGGKHAFWGLLCDGNRESSCANAYEREALGWITVPEIPRDSTVRLSDYVTTGAAYKYQPPNGDPLEYFYFENHQNFSVLDDVSKNTADTGLWILHQQGPYNNFNNIRIAASDGNWHWPSPQMTSACYSQPLPLFERGAPQILGGLSHRDMLSTPQTSLAWMNVYRNEAGEVLCGSMFAGENFTGAYAPGGQVVFSPWSNPSSATWANAATDFSLEVVGQNATALFLRAPTNSLDVSPARRTLFVASGADSTNLHGTPLIWGNQSQTGQELEADVDSSEVQRAQGISSLWTTVFHGSQFAWIDSSTAGDSSIFTYRARVHDTQGKYSAWSRSLMVKNSRTLGVDGPLVNVRPKQFGLEQNFPNPFNPVTQIRFQVGQRGLITLKVVDLLGREVAMLVHASLPPGEYTAPFDGSRLASGVYFARLESGGRIVTRKMVLVK